MTFGRVFVSRRCVKARLHEPVHYAAFAPWQLPTISANTRNYSRAPRPAPRGFTLIEALATLVVIGAVLPVAMHALSLATAAAGMSARQMEAANLAESKLAELISTQQWQTGPLEGNFSRQVSDLPGFDADAQTTYRWRAWTEPWIDMAMLQLHLEVTWEHRGREHGLQLVTLVRDEG